MKKTLPITLIYAALIISVFALLLPAVSVKSDLQINNKNGLFVPGEGSGIYIIGESAGEKYNDRLLLPENIKDAVPDDTSTDYEHYVTFRFVIPVKDGESYAITCRKSDYAVNVYIDGELKASTGQVTDNKEEFVPSAAAYTAFFTGKGDTAEVVIQRANFNHNKHYSLWFRFGTAEAVSDYNSRMLLQGSIVAVILISSALIDAGIFLCFPSKKETLWFSLLCILVAVRAIFPTMSAYLLPGVNWYLSHKLETCSLSASMLFAVLYVQTAFKRYIIKYVQYAVIAVNIAVLLLFVLAPSNIYSRYNEICIVLMLSMTFVGAGCIVAEIIKSREKLTDSNSIALAGMIFCLMISVGQALEYLTTFIGTAVIGTTTGLAILAFFNSLAIAVDFRSSMDKLDRAEERERELASRNSALLRIDNIRETFLADLGHELKTPLTVIASNSAVASKQLSLGRNDERTVERLDSIEREAVRLGKMVEKLKNSASRRFEGNAEIMDLKLILKSASDFCEPLCAKNNNTLSVSCPDGLSAAVSSNIMFHCLYNLLSNASKHSRENTIEITASGSGGEVIVAVCDHGDGMTEEQMQHAFERGYSGDSSTGIGLPLCRELIESEGGSIELDNTAGGGLTVKLHLKETGNVEDTSDRG